MSTYEEAQQKFGHFAHGDGSNQPASSPGERWHASSADEAVRALGVMVDDLPYQIRQFEQPPSEVLTLESKGLTFHTRILIKQNSKSYSHETSVSVDGDDISEITKKLEELNRVTDSLARLEIVRRQALDASDKDEMTDREFVAHQFRAAQEAAS